MAVLSDAQREAGWTEHRLSDVIELIGGGTPKTTVEEYWNGSIPWLSVVDFSGDSRYVSHASKSITQLGLENSSTKLLNPGDLILSARGTVGELAQLTAPMAFNQSCFGIRSNFDGLSQNYLYYLLLTVIGELRQNSHGSIFSTVNRKTFESVDIVLPPLEEQERIAGILGSLDDKIEANTRLIQTLDSLGEAATRKYLKSVQKTQKLNDIAHIVMGQSPKGETLNTEGSGVLFFQGKKDFGFRYPTPRTYTTAATRMAEPLDILFSVRAPIGALNRSVEACCVGRGLAAIRSSCGQENTLFYTLKTNPNLWEKFEGEGTIFSAINKKGLSELDIPFSETAISNGVEDFLTSVEQEIFSLEQENLQLAETRDALIKRLID
ncbi:MULTISPECIES: restriction endonuclease subunit S [Rothia]|uniref:restriction endonuclease subunit S n=1 Tax=Rothia TaxID=32207 RepID=UPI0009F3B0FC|nr:MULTISPECIES: restriction endonuclease subunit S [Rothia]